MAMGDGRELVKTRGCLCVDVVEGVREGGGVAHRLMQCTSPQGDMGVGEGVRD